MVVLFCGFIHLCNHKVLLCYLSELSVYFTVFAVLKSVAFNFNYLLINLLMSYKLQRIGSINLPLLSLLYTLNIPTIYMYLINFIYLSIYIIPALIRKFKDTRLSASMKPKIITNKLEILSTICF